MNTKTALLFVAGLTALCCLAVVGSRVATVYETPDNAGASTSSGASAFPSGLSIADTYNEISDNSRFDEYKDSLGQADRVVMTGDGKSFADMIYRRGTESLIVSVDTIQDGSWRVVDVYWCQGATDARPYGTKRREKFPNSATPALG